jgi:hypothetical protein
MIDHEMAGLAFKTAHHTRGDLFDPNSLPISQREQGRHVMRAAQAGRNVHNLSRAFNADDTPLWLMCFGREHHLHERPTQYAGYGFRGLIDENQSPRVTEPIGESLGITACHIDTHERMKGAHDLQVVRHAVERGYQLIVTSDKREAVNSPYPHLTKVVKDLARTVSRAFFLEDKIPTRFLTLPMVLHVPAFGREKSWQDTVDLIKDQKSVIREHLQGRETLVLSYSDSASRKPAIVTHTDIITETLDSFDSKQYTAQRGVQRRREKSLDNC